MIFTYIKSTLSEKKGRNFEAVKVVLPLNKLSKIKIVAEITR